MTAEQSWGTDGGEAAFLIALHGTTAVGVVTDGVGVISSPRAGNAYGAGETISVDVEFEAPVTVDGLPTVSLDIGGERLLARYEGGSGTTTLTFSHVLGGDANDEDGVEIIGDSLALNGGSILAGERAASAAFAQVGPLTGHKVDGVSPHLVRTTAAGALLTLYCSEPLDRGSTPAPDAFWVQGMDVQSVTVGESTVILNFGGSIEGPDVVFSYRPGTSPSRTCPGTAHRACAMSRPAWPVSPVRPPRQRLWTTPHWSPCGRSHLRGDTRRGERLCRSGSGCALGRRAPAWDRS